MYEVLEIHREVYAAVALTQKTNVNSFPSLAITYFYRRPCLREFLCYIPYTLDQDNVLT